MHLILLVAILAPFAQLATRVAAYPNIPRSPVVALSIQKRFIPGLTNPAKRDLIRARNPVEGVQRRDSGSSTIIPINVPLTLNNNIVYTAVVGIGDPATAYELAIDTGSSNTWVGANKAYNPTHTRVNTTDRVNITYGSGNMTGTEYLDTVTIARGVAISGQSIGVASNTSSSGFFPLDGILGVGPADLTLGTLIPNNTNVIPTVTDNLFKQGKIEQRLIAVSFEPTNSTLTTNGEITFGGIDTSKFTGEINYTPLTHTYPASKFWGINASFKYGNDSCSAAILNSTAGFVDTGTTLFGLAPDAYNRYIKMTGAVFDNTTGLPRITPEQFNNLKSLFFEINGVTYELIPNAQIWPQALNTHIGGEKNGVYLVVFNIGPVKSGTVDFVIGLTALERFYSVFDSDNKKVGFATTQFTYANIN